MSDLGNHTLELLEWNPSHICFTQADPSVEDREEVGSFCLFQPNSFVDSIKIEVIVAYSPLRCLSFFLEMESLELLPSAKKTSWVSS
jgi:hypothetical protein